MKIYYNKAHMEFVNYYNKNAHSFIKRTLEIDISHLIRDFIEGVGPKGRILDLGCGSGRDSKTFKDLGYDVYAIDASEKMVDHTKQYLGDKVTLATFQDYETTMIFDGIWASASLLHVPEEDMISVVAKYRDFLKVGGIFHMSFKERDTHYKQGDRHFTCYNEETLKEMVESVGGFRIKKIYRTNSDQENQLGERWVNALLVKA